MLIALCAQFACDGESSSVWQCVADDAEQIGAQHAAGALIADVVGAEFVAVEQERDATVEIDYGLLVEQGCARCSCEIATDHEVAIAARHEDVRAAIGEGLELRGDFQRVGVTCKHRVAQPHVQQIAEHVEPISTGRGVVHKGVELRLSGDVTFAQMQVRNENRAHRSHHTGDSRRAIKGRV